MAHSYRRPSCSECAKTFHRNAKGEGLFDMCDKCLEARRLARKMARAASDNQDERLERGTGQAETPEDPEDYESWLSRALVLVANMRAMLTVMREGVKKLPVGPEQRKQQAKIDRHRHELEELAAIIQKIHEGIRDDEGDFGALANPRPIDQEVWTLDKVEELELQALKGDRLAIRTLGWLARKSLG